MYEIGLGDQSQVATSAMPQVHGPDDRIFESAHVASSSVKIAGTVSINAFERDVSLDDRVRAVGVFRVAKVNHVVTKDGSVERQQVLVPCADMELVPFDPADPNDDGIVRARPRP